MPWQQINSPKDQPSRYFPDSYPTSFYLSFSTPTTLFTHFLKWYRHTPSASSGLCLNVILVWTTQTILFQLKPSLPKSSIAFPLLYICSIEFITLSCISMYYNFVNQIFISSLFHFKEECILLTTWLDLANEMWMNVM